MNRRGNWKEAALGVVFSVLLTALMAWTIFFPPGGGRRGARVYVPLVLKTAQGIREGTRVAVLGVDRGAIIHLTYLPTNESGGLMAAETGTVAGPAAGQVVLAVARLNGPIDLYPNYSVSTVNAGVIAGKVVEIDPGHGVPGKLFRPRYLDASEVNHLIQEGRIRLRSEESLEAFNVDDPVTIAADVLYENRDGIRRIIKNTREITERINSGNGSVAALLNEDRLHRNLNDALGDTTMLVRDGALLYESYRENRAFIDLISVLPAIILAKSP